MPDLLAAARGKRVSALFARYGETYTVTRSGVSRSRVGLFMPMDSVTLATYFDGNESVGLLHPALILYADGGDTDPPAANDLFYRDSRSFAIRKTFILRLVSTPMLIIALCD